jgi:hypothetical protein
MIYYGNLTDYLMEMTSSTGMSEYSSQPNISKLLIIYIRHLSIIKK